MRRGPRRRGRAAELLLLLMPMGVPCALVFLASSDRIAERLGNPSSVWARLAGALPCALFLFVFTGLLVHALRADWRRFLGRDGHCLECGYDLRGCEADVCPECSAPIWR